MDIKRVVKEHGYTLSDVAQNMGITRVTLSQTISRNPTINTLQRIADVIGADIAEFFTDKPTANDDAAHIVCPHCGKPINIHID
jgi:transcriptional regulator with XRE-family HTH domain